MIVQRHCPENRRRCPSREPIGAGGLGFYLFYLLVILALAKWGYDAVKLVAARNGGNLAAIGEVLK